MKSWIAVAPDAVEEARKKFPAGTDLRVDPTMDSGTFRVRYHVGLLEFWYEQIVGVIRHDPDRVARAQWRRYGK